MTTTTHITGHRLFFTQISAVDKNCVEITKEGKIVATMNKRDRVIVKGYTRLILPKYVETECNKLLDELPEEESYDPLTEDDDISDEITDAMLAELDYTISLRDEIH